MNGSNGDWESDLRPIGLCPMDLAKLQACLGFDLAEREAALAAAFAEVGIPHFASFHARQGELLTAEPGAGCACCGPEVAAPKLTEPLCLPCASTALTNRTRTRSRVRCSTSALQPLPPFSVHVS